ncbi:MAG: acetyl-CoA acetyltransferase [Myxococcota bacterium]
MSYSGQFAIAGVHEYESRWAPDKTSFQIMGESTRKALADAGLSLGDVDGLFGATMTMGAMGIVQFAEYLDIKPRYLDGTNIGGSSFVSHVAHAGAAIHAGLCDVALIVYGSTAASDAMAIGTGNAGGRDPGAAFVSPYGMTLVSSYAMVARRHMFEFGTTSEQLADIAVSTRHHASLNPHAKMRQPITREDVLESRMIADPLHLLDCCIISDGGGAIIVTSLDRAKDLRQRPITILGSGESVAHREIGAPDLMTMAAKQSGEQAFAMAGLKPADIDLCTIYDSFTITVLLTLENLGFCPRGEGGGFVEKGGIGLGGNLPVNPDGGGLSSNHSGMRGIFLVIEAVRQLRGGLGERQVEGAELALVHGTGGYLGLMHSGATLILRKT